MTISDEEFTVNNANPYFALPAGPGRWYPVLTKDLEPYGYAWTNDRGGFGLLNTRSGEDVQASIAMFTSNLYSWGATGVSASEAFEASAELQEDWSNVPTVINSGDLLYDLIEREMGIPSMKSAETAQYGATVREDGEILEIIRTDITGTYVRENGSWTPLDPDADEDDNPTVYGPEWVFVSEDVIPYFDSHSGSDALKKSDIEQFIVNS